MAMCKSCGEKDATPRKCGLDLCVVCHPWVAASLRRTKDLPRWGTQMLTHDPEILMRTRDTMAEKGLSTGGPPLLEHNWIDYFRWLLSDDDEALCEMEQHVELRDDAEYIGEDSVEQIAGKLLCPQRGATRQLQDPTGSRQPINRVAQLQNLLPPA